jgi:acetyl-CoA carboxylase biotin carboxyl carrier protein
MQLDIEKLRAVIDLLNEKKIAELEFEDEKVRFRITRYIKSASAPQAVYSALPLPPAPAAAAHAAAHAGPPAAAAAATESADFVDVTSPFVGTFYRSPSPDAPSFVETGSVVRPGQTLCIIEAMKLMNEIEAECAGTVTEVFAQNGKAVEFGQKLFRIKRA